jgi:hypothetical protein
MKMDMEMLTAITEKLVATMATCIADYVEAALETLITSLKPIMDEYGADKSETCENIPGDNTEEAPINKSYPVIKVVFALEHGTVLDSSLYDTPGSSLLKCISQEVFDPCIEDDDYPRFDDVLRNHVYETLTADANQYTVYMQPNVSEEEYYKMNVKNRLVMKESMCNDALAFLHKYSSEKTKETTYTICFYNDEDRSFDVGASADPDAYLYRDIILKGKDGKYCMYSTIPEDLPEFKALFRTLINDKVRTRAKENYVYTIATKHNLPILLETNTDWHDGLKLRDDNRNQFMVRGDECTECRLEEVAAEYRRKMLDEGKNFYLVQLEYETTDLGSPANVDENDPIAVLYKERCKYAKTGKYNVYNIGLRLFSDGAALMDHIVVAKTSVRGYALILHVQLFAKTEEAAKRKAQDLFYAHAKRENCVPEEDANVFADTECAEWPEDPCGTNTKESIDESEDAAADDVCCDLYDEECCDVCDGAVESETVEPCDEVDE